MKKLCLALMMVLFVSAGVPALRSRPFFDYHFDYQTGRFESSFPQGVLMQLNVTPREGLASATLYLTMDGNVLFNDVVDIPPHDAGDLITLSGRWDGRAAGGEPCPPWAILRLWWVLVDEAGNSISTVPVERVYVDSGRGWQVTPGAFMSAYTYQQGPQVGQAIVQAGDEALLHLRKVYGYVLPYHPVFVLYNSQQDGARDLGYANWEPFSQDIIGRAYPGTSTMIALGNLDDALIRRVVTHELAHLYQFQAGGRFFNAPFWWIEGDARAQEPAAFRAEALQNVRGWRAQQQLPYLPGWYAEPANPAERHYMVDIGASFVIFLQEVYGLSAYQRFYKTWLRVGDFYQAFSLTYGLSLAQLDLKWRAWIAGWL